MGKKNCSELLITLYRLNPISLISILSPISLPILLWDENTFLTFVSILYLTHLSGESVSSILVYANTTYNQTKELAKATIHKSCLVPLSFWSLRLAKWLGILFLAYDSFQRPWRAATRCTNNTPKKEDMISLSLTSDKLLLHSFLDQTEFQNNGWHCFHLLTMNLRATQKGRLLFGQNLLHNNH